MNENGTGVGAAAMRDAHCERKFFDLKFNEKISPTLFFCNEESLNEKFPWEKK